jgi:MoaA/NifB/PqqE/SkfB family radical SAM enzyme
MFNKLENIRSLEVELSTYCNAACPGCARHYWGTSTKLPNLVEQHLSVETVTKVIEQIPNAKEKLELHLVGNIGDPFMNPDIYLGLLEWSEMVESIHVDTNGGMQTEAFWRNIGRIENLHVTFSIDGLEDTNHIYRVNVDWDKVQRNFRAFIRAGGKAIWKFLVFDHNKHQLDDVHKRSREEGFWRFRSEASMRISDDKTVKNFATKEHTKLKEIQNKIQDDISCKALDINRLYINAESRIWPCCYTSQRYQLSHFNLPELTEFTYLYNHYKADFNDARKFNLQQILEHEVWDHMKQAWQDRESCEYKVCWKTCRGGKWKEHNAVSVVDEKDMNAYY